MSTLSIHDVLRIARSILYACRRCDRCTVAARHKMSDDEMQTMKSAGELGKASYITSAAGVVVAVIVILVVLIAVSRQLLLRLSASDIAANVSFLIIMIDLGPAGNRYCEQTNLGTFYGAPSCCC